MWMPPLFRDLLRARDPLSPKERAYLTAPLHALDCPPRHGVGERERTAIIPTMVLTAHARAHFAREATGDTNDGIHADVTTTPRRKRAAPQVSLSGHVNARLFLVRSGRVNEVRTKIEDYKALPSLPEPFSSHQRN